MGHRVQALLFRFGPYVPRAHAVQLLGLPAYPAMHRQPAALGVATAVAYDPLLHCVHCVALTAPHCER
jgi:hypothetical protein